MATVYEFWDDLMHLTICVLLGLGKPNGYLYLIEMNIMRKHNRIKWAHWPTIQTTLVCVALVR